MERSEVRRGEGEGGATEGGGEGNGFLRSNEQHHSINLCLIAFCP